jgi:hypothetical protein
MTRSEVKWSGVEWVGRRGIPPTVISQLRCIFAQQSDRIICLGRKMERLDVPLLREGGEVRLSLPGEICTREYY